MTPAEAASRGAPYGPVGVRGLSGLWPRLRRFRSPLVAILLVLSAIVAGLGQPTEAAIIVTMMILRVGIACWQTCRSEPTVDRRRSRGRPTATVRRNEAGDGRPMGRRPSRPLVITSVVMVAIGVVLPATPLTPFLPSVVAPAPDVGLWLVALVFCLLFVDMARRARVPRLGL